MLGDGVTAVLVFMFVSRVRFGDGDSADFSQRLGIDIRLAAVLFAVAWVSALWSMRLYQLRIRWSLLTEARDIAGTTLLIVALTLSTLYVVNQNGVSRLFLAVLFLTQPVVTLAGRVVIRQGFGILRRRGYNTRYMLIAGTGTLAQDFADRVEGRTGLGIRIIGHLSVPGEAEIAVSRPILGSLEGIEAIFHSQVVDEVAVCLPSTAAHLVPLVTELAATEGKIVRIPVDPRQEVLEGTRPEEFEGFLVRSFVSGDQPELRLVVKRLIDIAGAAVGLVVLGPLLLGTALAIRVRDGSPILFRQARVGLHGRPFRICKFRTMVPDAEARLAEVQHLNERNGIVFKATDDPRLTPLGRTLRATSIDELPQLWNVLRGDMSLVGPRPLPVHEVAEFDIWHRRRHSMKPGITGLWQVEARTEPEFDRWVERDLTYIDRWSLLLDLKILLRTIPAVIGRTGR